MKRADKWLDLRQGLFRSVEPRVEIMAMMQPFGRYAHLTDAERMPGFTARASHESEGTMDDDIRLNRKLIEVEHDTPLRGQVFTLEFSGVSKSLQAQWTRHQAGISWIFRSTRFVSADKNSFVYSTYDYIDDEEKVRALYSIDEGIARRAVEAFDQKKKLGASKEDSRKIMPVIFATAGFVTVNVQELRHIFKMRLDKPAEWEIRRFHRMVFDLVYPVTPSLFEDFRPLRDGDW